MLINKANQPRVAAGSVVSADAESRIRNDRQSYISIARTLAKAQFVLADAELSRRLWQDVADRDLEVARILYLLYGGWNLESDDEATEADELFLTLQLD